MSCRGGRRFVGLALFFGFGVDSRSLLDAITFAGDGDELGVMQKAVEDGSGGGRVGELPGSASA